MSNNGIMEEIRSHLAQGKSSAEVIALGFKPPTVYKARRQLRRLNTKIEQPQQLASLGELASEYVSLDRIAELETKAGSASEWERK